MRDQMQPPAASRQPPPRPLLLLSEARRRQPGRRNQIVKRQLPQPNTRASILSVLHADGARPLTFWASAINNSQPGFTSSLRAAVAGSPSAAPAPSA